MSSPMLRFAASLAAWFAASMTAVLTCATAQAAAPLGPYVGVGIGSSNVTVQDNDGNCCSYYYYGYDYEDGEADVGFTVHAGWRFLPYLALEVGYLDAGEPSWDDRYVYVRELDEVFDTQVDLDLQAAQVSALGILPFANIWEVYLRLGASYWWADADQRLWRVFDGAPFGRRIDDEGTDLLVGIGLGASPTPAWHLRLEFQSFQIQENLLLVHDDATLDSIVFETQYRFGR